MEDKISCPVCGQLNDSRKRFCIHCGKMLPAPEDGLELLAEVSDLPEPVLPCLPPGEQDEEGLAEDVSGLEGDQEENLAADEEGTEGTAAPDGKTEQDAVPESVSQPMPQPTPQPIPQPAPQLTPQPAPRAVPQPTPQPVPQPVPEEDLDPAPGRKSQYAPISTAGFLGIFLLLLVPVLNIVLLFLWASGHCRKRTKQNFARALLILILIIVVLAFFFSTSFGQALLWDWWRSILKTFPWIQNIIKLF